MHQVMAGNRIEYCPKGPRSLAPQYMTHEKCESSTLSRNSTNFSWPDLGGTRSHSSPPSQRPNACNSAQLENAWDGRSPQAGLPTTRTDSALTGANTASNAWPGSKALLSVAVVAG